MKIIVYDSTFGETYVPFVTLYSVTRLEDDILKFVQQTNFLLLSSPSAFDKNLTFQFNFWSFKLDNWDITNFKTVDLIFLLRGESYGLNVMHPHDQQFLNKG